MKIGYFISLFPYPESFKNSAQYSLYPVGGGAISAFHLACYMVKLGHEVSVFTTSVDSSDHFEICEGMHIFRYGTNFRLYKAFFSFGLFFKAIKQNVDIVHLHYSTPPAILASFFYAMVKKKPYIITYHGDMPENFGNLVRRVGVYLFNRFFVHRILSSAEIIISPSEYYIDQSRFLSRHRKKIITIPYGISAQELDIPYTKEDCRIKLSFSADDMIILFVGALMESKNPDLLIKALPAIIQKIPKARLIVAGVGSMRHGLEVLTRKLGLSDRVRFSGGVTGELKAMYFKIADVFSLPSIMEVFPIVIMESALAGLPMVVSNLSTFRCFIEDGYNGLMVRVDSIDFLAEAIIRLLSDRELREKLGRNANRKIKDYSWESIAKKTEDIYKNIAERV